MHISKITSNIARGKLLIAIVLLFICYFATTQAVQAASNNAGSEGRLVTIHDRGSKKVILTKADNVQDAIKDAGISLSSDDVVEPSRSDRLVASSYTVNIYRARPIVVVDGAIRQKVMTAAQMPKDIAAAAGISLRDEDEVSMDLSRNIIADGAGIELDIDRATEFSLKLYGKQLVAYSQAATVGEMIETKGIKLSDEDTVSLPLDTELTPGIAVEIWREGVQTTTIEEEVAFSVRKVLDADRQIGYREVQTAGVPGKKDVVYEITASGGKEVGRKAIQSVVTREPTTQVEIIGTKPGPNSLTKSKGAQQYTDSRGVVHRETYYDLPMNVVMGACGGGGYSVRADGAKIDKDGFILVAAHLGNYPRCSIVETSMGPGKVYDTGGFVAKHPHGFDLATDWTNNDGR